MQNTGFVLVNLQPYREKVKKEKVRQTAILMIFFAFLGAMAIGVTHSAFQAKIDNQNRRNDFVTKINKNLDEQIKDISGLKESIVETLAKRKVVESLQVNRSDGVIILNELANKLPEGSLIKSVKRTGSNIVIVGQTQSQAKVSDFMNALKKVEFFGDPTLTEIKAVDYVSATKLGKKVDKADVVKINEFTMVLPVRGILVDEPVSKKSERTEKTEKADKTTSKTTDKQVKKG